eukprot:10617478-Ditylum_brightwellii.AAC.1
MMISSSSSWKADDENLLNNFCLIKKQCYQVKKLYSGVHGGCTHFNVQEDEWWSPMIEISDKNKDDAGKIKKPAFMFLPLKKKCHLATSLILIICSMH